MVFRLKMLQELKEYEKSIECCNDAIKIDKNRKYYDAKNETTDKILSNSKNGIKSWSDMKYDAAVLADEEKYDECMQLCDKILIDYLILIKAECLINLNKKDDSKSLVTNTLKAIIDDDSNFYDWMELKLKAYLNCI